MGSITTRDKWPPEPPQKPAKHWEWQIVDGVKKLVPIKKKTS
jgi:hypothetical protein